ncbi:Sapep family Mn(2+)-dependent dipeptidase [Spiroplasma endosymbiont of Lonchoptera lutea]|uniref:Sapep family Mn(2+)-dependent dipeptidase n=1 Tax=Spiroplasma endosymbiont of Lonchoptera lutea TaxID=3066297 RepID=UPI0030CDD401
MESDINEQRFNDLFQTSLEEIKAIIKVPSFSNGEVNEQYPYGKNVHQVLEDVIDLGKKLGFKTKLGTQNRYGYIEYGAGKELIGILCHLDVVPPGDLSKWEFPPFEPTIKNDILYGRGVIDDKGPAIINLFALKYLVDEGFIPQKRIRLIFGITEETTWDSIKHYMNNEEKPKFAYTPDGYFPFVYAEKTILNLKIIEKNPQQDFTVNGGAVYNVTCDQAEYRGSQLETLITVLEQNKFLYKKQDNKVIVLGKAAHGSKPQEGINAGLQLVMALATINNDSKLVMWIAQQLRLDPNAINIFTNIEDESGKLTLNVGFIEMNSKTNFIGCDFRIPVHTDVNVILKKLEASLAPYNLVIEQVDLKEKLFFDKNSLIVKKLLNVYQQATNDMSQPLAIGGGTYARSMENCVAFGAIFDSNTSTEHQYNEQVLISDLKKAMKIYIQAIIALDSI